MNKKSKNKNIFYITTGILFISIFIGSITLAFSGDDYWWHLKAGEWIYQNKQVPKQGILSWYAMQENIPWFAHEWLFELFIYIINIFLGPLRAAYLYIAMASGILAVLLYKLTHKDLLKNIIVFLLMTLAVFYMYIGVISPRPHLLTLSFFILLIKVCENIKNDDKYNKYFLFIPIAILWSNWHGGSSTLLYILPLIYFVGNIFSFELGKIESIRIKRPSRFIKFALINAACIIINPRGFSLYIYPYSYTDEQTRYISEWASTNLRTHPIQIIFIIGICIFLIITIQKLLFSDIMMIGAFMVLSLKSVRFTTWLAIVIMLLASKYTPYMKSVYYEKYYHYFSAFMGIVLCILSGMVFVSIPNYNNFNMIQISYEAIEILQEEKPERLFNGYNYGSYLTYWDIPVFVDGRADMYDGYNLQEAVHLSMFDRYDDLNTSEIVEKYDFDYFIDSKSSLIADWLEDRPDQYEKIYEFNNIDENIIVIYKRR